MELSVDKRSFGATARRALLLWAWIHAMGVAAAPPSFQVKVYETSGVCPSAQAIGMNRTGTLLMGCVQNGEFTSALVWSDIAGPRHVPIPGMNGLYRMNDREQVVASRLLANGRTIGVMADPVSGQRDIQPLVEGTDVAAVDVNNAGTVLVTSLPFYGPGLPFLWSPAGSRPLAAPVGYQATGSRINQSGTVAGFGRLCTGGCKPTKAIVWKKPAMPGMARYGAISTEAYYLNDRGDVAGCTYLPQATPLLYSAGIMEVTSKLPGALWAAPRGLNNSSQMVGRSYDDARLNTGFWWSKAEGVHALDQLIADSDTLKGAIHIWEGSDINDAGQVLAKAVYLNSGQDVIVRLDPVP